MPVTKTVSDLQRNITEIYDLCKGSDEPVYITKNGQAEMVVMSADAYEELLPLTRRVYEYESRLRDRAVRVYDSMKAGNERSLQEARAELGA